MRRRADRATRPPATTYRTGVLQLCDYGVALFLLVLSPYAHNPLHWACVAGAGLLVGFGLITSGPLGLVRRPRGRHSRSVAVCLVGLALLASPAVWHHHLNVAGVLVPVVAGAISIRVASRTRRTRPPTVDASSPRVDPPRARPLDEGAGGAVAAEALARRAGLAAGALRDGVQEHVNPVLHRGLLRGARRLGNVAGAGGRMLRNRPKGDD
jgi:hypothetical protein